MILETKDTFIEKVIKCNLISFSKQIKKVSGNPLEVEKIINMLVLQQKSITFSLIKLRNIIHYLANYF